METKRILIVGGGFAGVWAAVGAAARLRRAGSRQAVSVELVSPDPYLVIRPRLYESDLGGVRVPLGEVLGPIGAVYRPGAVTQIDAAGRAVRLGDGSAPLDYDQLVLCAGSRLVLPGLPGVHAVDSYEQARALHRVIDSLARQPGARLAAAVVGGGFTGIETATELAGMLGQAAHAAGRAPGSVTLIERAPVVAPAFGPKARAVIDEALSSLGVSVRAGRAVAGAGADGVTLDDGTRVDADLVVWAAGPRASVLARQLQTRHDALGRVIVDQYLASGIDGIWVAGDSACAMADQHHAAVMSCQHATVQGRLAGQNAAAAALGRPPVRYRQPLYLTCLDLGAAGALLTCGFDRDIVLAAGPGAKRFKRFINRSLIYPPRNGTVEQVLAVGRPPTPGPLTAPLARMALRNGRFRDLVLRKAEDRAAAFDCEEEAA